MKIAFRVDSSAEIGIGHLIRCRSLAIHLKEVGHHVVFVSRDHKGNSNNLIKIENFKLYELKRSNSKNFNFTNIYQKWLGISQLLDAKQTIQTLENLNIDWIIVDHYGISKQWHKEVKKNIKKIIVIDDLASKQYACDAIINQNYNLDYKKLYKNRLHSNTQKFLGPRYSLIDPEYIKYQRKNNKKNREISNVFIYFGGEDNYKLTIKTIKALKDERLSYLKLHIVLPQKIDKKLMNYYLNLPLKNKNIFIYHQQRTLALIISKCDIAIGAGGSTLWERIYFLVPSFIISTAANQVMACKSLAKKNLINYLGDARHVDDNKISSTIFNTINNKIDLLRQVKKLEKLNIGSGIKEIINIIK